MRLIDADKADVNQIPSYYGGSCRNEDVQSWLDEQPMVDAKLIVHAKWIRTLYDGNQCSHCGVYNQDDYTNYMYCSCCGARMDLK